jgi:RNA polymerase sigma-70 factor (ECF subfamily)
MTARPNNDTFRWLETLYGEGSAGDLSDGRLLERYLSGTEAAGAAAFEVLVRRHGPMVLSVCRGVLRDPADADDAFQATFLVLARRAATVRDGDRLATWLGRVARRIAVRARVQAARRTGLEFQPELIEVPAEQTDALVAAETAAYVRDEVARLSESDQRVVRLTYWQGKTYEEAAELLACPVGTVRSRLARARERLERGLRRLGLAGGPASALMTPPAQPSEALIAQTLRAVSTGGTGAGLKTAVALGTVPASIAALVEGELAMTLVLSWKSLAALVLAGSAFGFGVSSLAQRAADAPARGVAAPPPAPHPEPQTPPPPQEVAAQPARGDDSLPLKNAGFEEGKDRQPDGWSQGATLPGVAYVWSHDTAHGGKASLGFKKSLDRYFPIAQWTQKLERKGESPRLKVSAWVRAEKAGKAILDAQFLDDKGEWTHAWVAYIGAKGANDPPVTHDWKRYEGVVAIPPRTRQITIAPQMYGPGSVWFDDVAAVYTSDPATDPTAP